MARKSRSTGVGRGNGAGSARTQFKDGMPSGNPLGRPRKPKQAPPRSLNEAIDAALRRVITATENNREKKMTQLQAMIELLVADYPKASYPSKLKLLQHLASLGENGYEQKPELPSNEVIHEFVARLAEEAERDQEYLRELQSLDYRITGAAVR